MVIIENDKMNGLALGSPISSLSPTELKQVDGYEADLMDGQEVLITLGINKTKEFSLNGQVINATNIASFLSKENPLVDDGAYIFPQYNLIFTYVAERGIFEELVIYDDSVKVIMETMNEGHYLDLLTVKNKPLHIPKVLELKPFKGLGDFVFGMSIEEFKEHFPAVVRELESRAAADLGDIGVRFDHRKLSQVQIASHVAEYEIILNGMNINSKSGLQQLKTTYPYEKDPSTGLLVFTTLGLAIWKNLLTLYVFDESLLAQWLDFNRPITSW